MGLGGAGSVRGASERIISGDRGLAVSAELTSPELAKGLRLVGFVDAGWLRSLNTARQFLWQASARPVGQRRAWSRYGRHPQPQRDGVVSLPVPAPQKVAHRLRSPRPATTNCMSA